MKRFPLLLSALLASACSSGVETRISSSGIASPQPEAYMVSTVSETSPELRSAYTLVAKKMAQKGFAIAKEAKLHAEITLDARDASLALGSGAGNLSAPKRRKPLQSCNDREYRFGITLTRVTDGAELYRGRAAEYHCKMTIAEVLPTLVDAALADLGQPRGSYAVVRKARD